jgi:4-coumarate--CoA ligase
MNVQAARPATLPKAPALAEPFTATFPADVIRRLCVSLVLAEQTDLVSKGQMPREVLRKLQDPHIAADDLDRMRLDEEGLGFDSLALLGLILRVNRFFNLSATGVEDYLLVQRDLGAWVALIGQHFDLIGAEAALTFDTSGSGGPVKHVTHKVSRLVVEMRSQLAGPLLPFDGASPRGHILSMVPPHHLYGFLFSCLLPGLIDASTIDLHRSGPGAVFRHAQTGDLIVGTPFNWDLLLRVPQLLPAGVFGVTSAGPSAATTWDVRAINGLASLTEIYGATETGGVGYRTGFADDFRLLPHLTRQGSVVLDQDGAPLDLQDHLDWQTPELFHLRGRCDDIVQVAGVNVSPAEVCRRIGLLDGVAEVAVRPGVGRMKAFIVPSPRVRDQAAFLVALQAHILEHLAPPARPASLTFGPALPRNAMGKACDWDVSA